MRSDQIIRLAVLLLALPAVHASLKQEHGSARRGWVKFLGELLPGVMLILLSIMAMGAIAIGLAKSGILPLGAAFTASIGLAVMWLGGIISPALGSHGALGRLTGERNARLLFVAIGAAVMITGLLGHSLMPD